MTGDMTLNFDRNYCHPGLKCVEVFMMTDKIKDNTNCQIRHQRFLCAKMEPIRMGGDLGDRGMEPEEGGSVLQGDRSSGGNCWM